MIASVLEVFAFSTSWVRNPKNQLKTPVLLANLLAHFGNDHLLQLHEHGNNIQDRFEQEKSQENNTYPLRMRVYQRRDYKTYSLGIDLRETNWDEQTQQVKTSHPSHKLHNVKLATLKAKIQKSIFMNETEDEIVVPEALISQMAGNGQKKQAIKPDILAYVKQHIAKLESAGQVGNAILYSCAINKLRSYAKSDTMAFEQVTYSYIEQFNTALLASGMRVNGIFNYMRTIRAVFNKAIKESIISADCYLFSKFNIKNERTINRTLTVAEIARIANLDLHLGTPIWHHRNLFILPFLPYRDELR